METLLGIGFASIIATAITVLFLVFIRKVLKQMFDEYCEIDKQNVNIAVERRVERDNCPVGHRLDSAIIQINDRLDRIESKMS